MQKLTNKIDKTFSRLNRLTQEGKPPYVGNSRQDEGQDEGQLDTPVKFKLHKETNIAEQGRNEEAADHGNTDGKGKCQDAVSYNLAVRLHFPYLLCPEVIEQYENSRYRSTNGNTDSDNLQEERTRNLNIPGAADDNGNERENIVYLIP